MHGIFTGRNDRKARARMASAMLESLESRTHLSTYYVSNSGSDSAAGSTTAPFATLQKAANTAIAGDTVIVRPGTYVGMDLLGSTYGGTSAAPITFIANTGDYRTSGVTVNSIPTNHNQYADINIESTKGWYVIKGFNVAGGGASQKANIRVANSPNCQILENQTSGGFTGIFASLADGLLVQGNRTHDATDQHGIYVNGTNGFVIRDNISYNNAWDGIHTNVLDGGNTINTNGVIDGNIVYGNNLSGFDITGASFTTIENNVVYGNARHGIVLQNTNQNPTPACHDVEIVNNTLDASSGQWGIEVTSGNNVNVTIFNNVLMGGSSGGPIGTAGTLPTSFKSDYNAITGSFSQSYTGPTLESMSQWQANTGQDAHSLTASTQWFAGYAAANYHLAAGSPGIDKGLASLAGQAAPATDFEGDARPQGNGYDIGADEYASGTTVMVPAAPTGLVATATSPSQVNLSWTDNATNETGFKVARAVGTTGTFALVASLARGPRATSTRAWRPAHSTHTTSAPTTPLATRPRAPAASRHPWSRRPCPRHRPH